MTQKANTNIENGSCKNENFSVYKTNLKKETGDLH